MRSEAEMKPKTKAAQAPGAMPHLKTSIVAAAVQAGEFDHPPIEWWERWFNEQEERKRRMIEYDNAFQAGPWC